MEDSEVEDVVAAIAARHGILLDRNDPAAAIPTLVEIGVERAVARLASKDSARDSRAVVLDQVREEVARIVREEANLAVVEFRTAVRRDLDGAGAVAATLVANIAHAQSRTGLVQWLSIGLCAAAGLLAAGVCIGRYLL